MIVVLSVVGFLLIGGLGILLVLGLHQGHTQKLAVITPAPVSVSAAMTTIPASTYVAVGAGTVVKPGTPAATGGQPLGHNKPEVLFISAQFCPFCAAERWAIVAALARFGRFTNLDTTTSEEYDVSTFSFLRTTYTSPDVTFVGRDVEDQHQRPLQKLTHAQNKQWETYLSPGATEPGFPFLDIDGRYVVTDANVDVNQIVGKSAQQIATATRDPSSSVSKTVLGAANQITAAVCRVTNDQPATACTPQIQAIGAQLPAYRR